METGKREDIETRASGTTPVVVQGTGGMGREDGGLGEGIVDVAMAMVVMVQDGGE